MQIPKNFRMSGKIRPQYSPLCQCFRTFRSIFACGFGNGLGPIVGEPVYFCKAQGGIQKKGARDSFFSGQGKSLEATERLVGALP